MIRNVGAALAVAVSLLIAVSAASAENLRFMTGPQGGSWVPLGGAMKDMWEKNISGLNVQALPGAGIANVRAIEEGKADIGFGNTISTVDALAGNEPFKKKHTNVCNLTYMYPQYFQVVTLASSGIKTVKDFKGKVVTTLPRGNTTEVANLHMVMSNGLSYKDMKVNFVSSSDSVAQMKDGHADVWSMGTGIPAGVIMDLAASAEIRLIDLSSSFEGMKKLNPGYGLAEIPANTYPKQTEPVKVPTYGTHIVISCKLPEQTVYSMFKTIAENVPTLASIHRGMEPIKLTDLAQDVGVPHHPGVLRYLKEKGVTPK